MAEELTIKEVLEQVYKLIQLRLEMIDDREYPGKEIDTSYFKGMDDGLKEIFGRLDMYNILDLPVRLAELVASGKIVLVEEEYDAETTD